MAPAQLDALAATINDADADVVVSATPVDLARLLRIDKKMVRARYEFAEAGEPKLSSIVDAFVERTVAQGADVDAAWSWRSAAMRSCAADEPLEAEVQRRNLARRCRQGDRANRARAPARHHTRQRSADWTACAAGGSVSRSVRPYPLDVLGAESEGMIGYLIEQALAQ